MKKSLLALALASVMVFGFASSAYADHSPQFYFDFQTNSGVTQGAAFQAVFPPAEFKVSFDIQNGTSPHGTYSQSSAKCGVCHAVHRAPVAGTASFATTDRGGTARTSSRYAATAWTSSATTELLLKSTANGACAYCHISSGAIKMYGGDPTFALVGDTAFGWGEFYAHTTGCTSCHAVHGAYTFQGAGVAGLVLKYQGVKKLGTVPLVVQPEVYTDSPLYANKADMIAGNVKSAALAAGVSVKAAAVTAQCSVCHASYSPASNQLINPAFTNATLFQPTSWASANGSVAKIFVGNAADPAHPVSALPGIAGLTYTQFDLSGSAGSLIMSYKNHPMKAADPLFNGAGASAGVKGLLPVSNASSYTCPSCHNAPKVTDESNGTYLISSFPHYTPGYYKFMKAANQAAFDTPSTLAEFALGRAGFFSSRPDPLGARGTLRPGKPAVMNDGYCTKCHDSVGTTY